MSPKPHDASRPASPPPSQLEDILARSTEPAPGVGVLSSNNRDIWARDFLHLSSTPANAALLQTIHSAAFVLCLDPARPDGLVDFSRHLWHGALGDTGVALENRWVDKPVNLVVFDDGKAGIMGEHSVMDGTPTVTLCDVALDLLADPAFDHGAAPSSSSASAAQPEQLKWAVDDTTRRAISEASAALRTLVTAHAMGAHQTAYGKRAIKAFGVSPDSWAQMIVQLAFARLGEKTGVPRAGGTYEAATTRRFLKGRTEAIRVVSTESDAWVASMLDTSASDEARRALFAKAGAKHVERAKAAGKAQGVDRHLLGLKKVLREGEALPEVFGDALVGRSSYWVLSTSAVFSKHFGPYGWGEVGWLSFAYSDESNASLLQVVPDGFGVAYMTGFDGMHLHFAPSFLESRQKADAVACVADYLQFTVTSRTDMPNTQFVAEIERAAKDLYDLFSRTGAGAGAKAKL